MAMKQKQPAHDLSKLKPGSSAVDARAVPGKDDFGARADDRPERDYTSANTKHSDRGSAQPLANEERSGNRTAGVSGKDAGPGSSSGGDLDTDFVGIAGGTGLAQNIDTEHHAGADDSDGSSDEFASGSGGHAQGRNQVGVGKVGGDHNVDGSTLLRPDERTDGPHGADATSRQGDGNDDDAFVGEVSTDEASGRNRSGD
jgi:hypothetical protein